MTTRILVLGGYGLIGSAVVARALAAGHVVTGLGRSGAAIRKAAPDVRWHLVDIAKMTRADAWETVLEDVDVIVNAAGALQSGGIDDVQRVHDVAIGALVDACEQRAIRRFVQISAPGATPQAGTEFMRSKARGDARLRGSTLDWVILRPGLVIGADAYGGTALLRALAAFPRVQPLVHGSSLVQTVALEDVAGAALAAAQGQFAPGTDIDLVETEPHTLGDIVAAFRRWLGFEPATRRLDVPVWLAGTVARAADVLGRLGWRSPVRTTALDVLRGGVRGDPATAAAAGWHCRPLTETLAGLPATAQERWFARGYLALPGVLTSLAVLWIGTGVVTLTDIPSASAILLGALDPALADLVAIAGALVDIGIGGALLIRRFARRACFAMIAVTMIYLAGGSVFLPELWLDPLGAFLKTLPAMMLAWLAAGMLVER